MGECEKLLIYHEDTKTRKMKNKKLIVAKAPVFTSSRVSAQPIPRRAPRKELKDDFIHAFLGALASWRLGGEIFLFFVSSCLRGESVVF
jgi:hypothetical protein